MALLRDDHLASHFLGSERFNLTRLMLGGQQSFVSSESLVSSELLLLHVLLLGLFSLLSSDGNCLTVSFLLIFPLCLGSCCGAFCLLVLARFGGDVVWLFGTWLMCRSRCTVSPLWSPVWTV